MFHSESWGFGPGAAVFVGLLLVSVVSHLWLPHETLLVQMVFAAGPQLRKRAKEGCSVLVLIFKCQALFWDILMIRSSSIGCGILFSSKLSCFF